MIISSQNSCIFRQKNTQKETEIFSVTPRGLQFISRTRKNLSIAFARTGQVEKQAFFFLCACHQQILKLSSFYATISHEKKPAKNRFISKFFQMLSDSWVKTDFQAKIGKKWVCCYVQLNLCYGFIYKKWLKSD